MGNLSIEKKLNLGSGEFKKAGFINVDYYSVSEPDVRHDLNQFPYLFDDNDFDLIEAYHVLEHLKNPFSVVKELHRIGKQNALIIMRVPHFSRGFTHAEHKRGFDVSFPFSFDSNFKRGYQGTSLELVELKLHWFAQPELKDTVLPKLIFYISRVTETIFDFIANLSPYLCSRF